MICCGHCCIPHILQFFPQIDRLKKRYDAWQMASKESGSVLYFEPLKIELHDCFGALKDVCPDLVYSNLKGSSSGRENSDGNDESNTESNTETSDAQPSTSTATTSSKKTPKSNCHNILLS